MPFKSEKQRKWMHANEPEMAKKWEKKKKSESFNFLKKGIKAFVSEKMNPEQYHRYMQYVFDTQFNTPEEKKMKKSIIKKINKAQKKKGLPVFKESVNEAERDYKDEYKKFQSSTKSKKYRAELNKYNRKKGTYGNGDGKDASHKGGKIAGFESQSKNRGRAEKSRLKKEDVMPDFEPMVDEIVDSVIKEYSINEDLTKLRALYAQLDKKFKKYDHTRIQDFGKVSKYLKTKFSKGSSLPDTVASFYNDYRGGEEIGKNHKRLFKYAKKMQGESVNEGDKRQLSENPAAMAAAAMATTKIVGAQGKKIKASSALQSSDPKVKKKAKSMFQRLKDKYAKKNFKGWKSYAWCKEGSLPVYLKKGYEQKDNCILVEKDL